MKETPKSIWIEAEQWEVRTWDAEDTNTDVIVVFPDRTKWIASFFTYKNIQTLREKNVHTGECMNGAYYWSSDMVLIDISSRERIEQVVENLIENDSFNTVFTRYPNVEAEDDYLYPTGFFVI
ncbi:hypothetical protein [Paenibacillus alginolyticus]|uniref:Uncharacterized protein n=1 Tax=Paenibacillus alginolyticus TaxID=59839 RepID=A0ABT4GPR9_9BACL|nr:hypothetical protein [Paenibacillus alginolyticus]MCY9698218.1 hypothetical protein [Paenibacillus alginolyticus]MEC0143696.1 hypothetical protein [Paenibacillus alginolyticus]